MRARLQNHLFGWRDRVPDLPRSGPAETVGGTDARHYTSLSDAVYRFIGMRVTRRTIDGYHGVDEGLPASEYLRVIALYVRLIERIDRLDSSAVGSEPVASCDSPTDTGCGLRSQ